MEQGTRVRQRRYRVRYGKLLARLAALVGILVLAVAAAKLFSSTRSAELYGGNAAKTHSPGPGEDAQGDLLILVNWEHPVPYDKPENLVSLRVALGDAARLQSPDGSIDAEAGEAARQMLEAADEEGLGPYLVTTAYRSVSYQDTLYSARLAEDPDYGSDPYKNPVKVLPGRCSEHTTGLAIDILSVSYRESDAGFADTPEGEWLMGNAHRFGFILRYPADKEHITGVIFEPWHYRYVGLDAAKEIHEAGQCLEEYLGEA